jgi:hypothetical protein
MIADGHLERQMLQMVREAAAELEANGGKAL